MTQVFTRMHALLSISRGSRACPPGVAAAARCAHWAAEREQIQGQGQQRTGGRRSRLWGYE